MILTEEEAKTKWCPDARVLLPINQAGNRVSSFQKRAASGEDRAYYVEQENDCRCLGSECAAWRWYEDEKLDRKGFCGRAGTPPYFPLVHRNDR